MRYISKLCLLVITGSALTACGVTNLAQAEIESPSPAMPITTALDPEAARADFLAAEDLDDRLVRLNELEQQALQLAVDQPLKLGSVGSAILDIYPASQTGHYILSKFYAHVEAEEARADHAAALTKIQADMLASGDGSKDTPYVITTIYDAHTHAESSGASPVGSIYQSDAEIAFGYLLIARPQTGPLTRAFYDLSGVLGGYGAPTDDSVNRGQILRSLATRMDTAAQAAIGRYLASIQKYEDAINWLQASARSGNLLANVSLARIFLIQAEAAPDAQSKDELRELALENHMHAIALGSSESMFVLANLYLNDYYGEENRSAGVALLKQAADLDHVESILYLGHLHNAGSQVPKDADLALGYYERAAELESEQGVLSYARFVAANPDAATNAGVIDWLEELADDENTEAMVVLGNLHARGIATKRSNRRALRWYKRAINKAKNDPDIVNEVAWTLTVSDIEGLPRTKYAKRIMDEMMESNEPARSRPEYLDTWAATYAARGDFDQAIELQERAIEAAVSQTREDVLPILEEHLKLFQAGDTITERAP